MRCLSDPVTVYRERVSEAIAYPLKREKAGRAMICEPGNLLDMREELPVKLNTPRRSWYRVICDGEAGVND